MFRRSHRSYAIALMAATSASAVFGGSASAQSSTDLTEIVVTAKNRTERLQDVPLAITAFTNDTLKQADIRDSRDLQKLTPALSIFSTGRNDPVALAVRGIAPNTSDERYQGISFFIDGVALSGQLTSLDTSQIERIEVIKGPQSASFGRATYTGAVNYITRDPSGDDVTGSVTLRGGGNKGNVEANYYAGGYVSFPILKDRLWGSLEGTWQQMGGVYKAINNGHPLGRERTQSVAGSLFWKPIDNFSVKLRSSYSHDLDTQGFSITQHPRDWLLAGAPTVALPRAGGALLATDIPDNNNSVLTDRSQNIDVLFPRGGFERDRYFTSLVANYSFNGYQLDYRAGYFYSFDARTGGSGGFTRSETLDPVYGPLVRSGQVTLASQFLPGTALVSLEKFVNWSHQLILLSPSDQRLRYKIGAYLFTEYSMNNFSQFRTPGNVGAQIRGRETLDNQAVFGSLDYDFTNQLSLSLEARYQRETISQEACLYCGQPLPRGQEKEESDFLPRATLSYKATPNNLLYALYSYGVKSGRFSAITIAGVPQLSYATPEKLDNYEIGSKNSFLGGKLVVNAAAYLELVEAQQLSNTVLFVAPNGGVSNLSVISNIGQSRVHGFELEGNWRATDALTFAAGTGYAHQEFTTKEPVALSAAAAVGFPGVAGSRVVLDGKSQANVPRWNGFVSAEYNQPNVWRNFTGSVRVSTSYRGKFFADTANVSSVHGAWSVNGRVRLYSDDLEIAVFGRNLFNDLTPTGTGMSGNVIACSFIERDTARFGTSQQCLTVSSPRPAEWGVELTKRF